MADEETGQITGEEPTVTEEQDQPEDDYKPDKVMILFMGSHHAHAITSIQYFLPDAVHIVTSDDFREPYVRRLNEWSKKYGFRKGKVSPSQISKVRQRTRFLVSSGSRVRSTT